MAKRVKLEAKAQHLTVTALARHVGLSRGSFSTRLNANRLSEAHVEALVAVLGRSAAYFRYGLNGDYRAGYRAALADVAVAVGSLSRRTNGKRPAVTVRSDPESRAWPPAEATRSA